MQNNSSNQAAGHDFAALYQELAPRIWRYLRRVCRDRHLAEEILQETFLAMYENRTSFEGRSSLATWAYRIATNKVIDKNRSAWSKADSDSRLLETVPDHNPGPEKQAIMAQEVQRLRDALDRLPQSQKTALILVRFEGLKYREAAEVLNVSLSTVRMRVYKGLLTLTKSQAGTQND